MVVVKFLGLIDLSAAIIIALMDIPYIGVLKWLIVAILFIKSIPSLIA